MLDLTRFFFQGINNSSLTHLHHPLIVSNSYNHHIAMKRKHEETKTKAITHTPNQADSLTGAAESAAGASESTVLAGAGGIAT